MDYNAPNQNPDYMIGKIPTGELLLVVDVEDIDTQYARLVFDDGKDALLIPNLSRSKLLKNIAPEALEELNNAEDIGILGWGDEPKDCIKVPVRKVRNVKDLYIGG